MENPAHRKGNRDIHWIGATVFGREEAGQDVVRAGQRPQVFYLGRPDLGRRSGRRDRQRIRSRAELGAVQFDHLGEGLEGLEVQPKTAQNSAKAIGLGAFPLASS